MTTSGYPEGSSPEGSITQPETGTARTGPQAASSASEVAQHIEGEGDQASHLHAATVHSHDHYHVSHHHKGSFLGEWDHRTSWHTHEHNHAPLQHSHDYSLDDEAAEHAKEAHVHDHDSPVASSA